MVQDGLGVLATAAGAIFSRYMVSFSTMERIQVSSPAPLRSFSPRRLSSDGATSAAQRRAARALAMLHTPFGTVFSADTSNSHTK
jgi:hypothetical protein